MDRRWHHHLVSKPEELADHSSISAAQLKVLLAFPAICQAHALLAHAHPRRFRQDIKNGLNERFIPSIDVDRTQTARWPERQTAVTLGESGKPGFVFHMSRNSRAESGPRVCVLQNTESEEIGDGVDSRSK